MKSAAAILTMIGRFIAYRAKERFAQGDAVSFAQNQSGVSALEFGLFAPILLLGLLSVADLALLAQQNMAVGHVLRAGAQEAMLDKSTSPSAPEVMKVLNLIAADSFAVGSPISVNGRPPLTLTASRYCICAENLGGPPLTSCMTICTGSKPPLIFYEIAAVSRSSNMILPQMSLRPRLQVQVR